MVQPATRDELVPSSRFCFGTRGAKRERKVPDGEGSRVCRSALRGSGRPEG